MQYGDANAVRLRSAHANGASETHVSWLYAVPGGWGWTICRECGARERKPA